MRTSEPEQTRPVQTWTPPEAGDRLGAYRILGAIGRGGMARIYEAEHVVLRRRVALKLLKPEMAQRQEEVARFFAEARAVNEIEHPNIVDVHDFVENPHLDPPAVYMVMERLDGEDLAARIDGRGPLDPTEIVRLIDPILDGLQAAHAVHILHRDLKPSNIFLAEIDGRVCPKLLDFGLAKAFGNRASHGLTNPRVVAGTPEYMAPEQITAAPLDGRTDIYNIGLLLYEALTGTRPFSGKQDTEILIKQVSEQPPPLNERRRPFGPAPRAVPREGPRRPLRRRGRAAGRAPSQPRPAEPRLARLAPPPSRWCRARRGAGGYRPALGPAPPPTVGTCGSSSNSRRHADTATAGTPAHARSRCEQGRCQGHARGAVRSPRPIAQEKRATPASQGSPALGTRPCVWTDRRPMGDVAQAKR